MACRRGLFRAVLGEEDLVRYMNHIFAGAALAAAIASAGCKRPVTTCTPVVETMTDLRVRQNAGGHPEAAGRGVQREGGNMARVLL